MGEMCDVSLGDYDGDAPKVFNSGIVTARKAHHCFECKAAIPPGGEYERVTGLWEGGWETYRFCLACSEISREFSDNGRSFGMLWDGMRENWQEGANLQGCLNRLSTVAAKTKLRDEWLKDKGITE
jgi:hypothetical protein